MYTGLVIVDVDGVIFKDIFLKKMVKSRGIKSYFKILLLGINYYKNKIPLEKLLKEGYRLTGNFNKKEALQLARKIKKVTHVKETIKILHQNNYYVSLISAGIPSFVLKSLANEIGADHYSGLELNLKGGSTNMERIEVISKVKIVDELLQILGLDWEKVISIGDDPGNLDLFKKSRIGIGFNPAKIVRQNSDVVIEGNDFLEILPYIIDSKKLPSHLKISRFSWKREIFRKIIHFSGAIFPFLAKISMKPTVYFLFSVIGIYFLSEMVRYRGFPISPFSSITKRALRHGEKKRIAYGPILLGLGIAVTLYFFPQTIYMPAILVVSICDSLSALIGKSFGKIRMFRLKNRTVEGSLAFFFSAFFILSLFFPLKIALPATLLSTALELITFYDLDNFFIPLGTALFLRFVIKP